MQRSTSMIICCCMLAYKLNAMCHVQCGLLQGLELATPWMYRDAQLKHSLNDANLTRERWHSCCLQRHVAQRRQDSVAVAPPAAAGLRIGLK